MAIKYRAGREPHENERRIIFQNVDREDWDVSLRRYQREGGYGDLRKALKMKPEEVVEEVKKSGLRGRGGAGFPCGLKWTFIPKNNTKPVYLICNADESEPGTFKDRYIIHQDPHQLIEGIAIAAFAVGAEKAFIYIREEFPQGAQILTAAIAEAHEAGLLKINGKNLPIIVHRGAGAYICGEETGLIESLEGKRPYPRIKPPYFPAVLGLYMCPTIVNNVETLCHVKHIIQMGGENYAKIGVERGSGTRIVGVSGDVNKPGYFEIEVGKVTMGELINDMCGGIKNGRKLKAIIPGGSSAKVLRHDEIFSVKTADGEKKLTIWDIPLDFDTMAACGSMAGSGGVIVMDETRSMVAALNNLNNFYAHESCGQCTPCREGALWMKKISDRLVAGKGTDVDDDTLMTVANNIEGKTICAFGEACSWPTQSFLQKFPEEFAEAAGKNIFRDVLGDEKKLAMGWG